MYEINGRFYTLEQLEEAAELYEMDFDSYLERMKEKGLKEVVDFQEDLASEETSSGLENDTFTEPVDTSSELLSYFWEYGEFFFNLIIIGMLAIAGVMIYFQKFGKNNTTNTPSTKKILKGNINDTFLYAKKHSEDNKEGAIRIYFWLMSYILKDKKNIFSGSYLKKKFKNATHLDFSSEYYGSNYVEKTDDFVHIIPLSSLFYNCGRCCYDIKDYESAKNYCEEAINFNPKCHPKIHHILGCSKIYLNDFTSCVKDFDNALKKDSSYFNSYYMRAVAYASDKCQVRDSKKAILDLKKYLEFNPTDKAAKNLLKTFKENLL